MRRAPRGHSEERLTDEQRQRVAILRYATCLLGDIDFRVTPRGFGAMQIHLARYARVEAQLGQVVGLALAVVRLTRQAEQLAVRDQGQPGIGHFRHQHELAAVPVSSSRK